MKYAFNKVVYILLVGSTHRVTSGASGMLIWGCTQGVWVADIVYSLKISAQLIP